MKFDPEKSLFDLSAVRWIAVITLFISLVVAATIAYNSNLKFNLTGEDFNFAIKTFQVPLGMLAVGLSLIGILGANHRSEQTKRQIERSATQIKLTQSQNNFANYYKHLEEFDKFCKAHTDTSIYSVKWSRKLHLQIFPCANQGVFAVSKEFIEQLTAEAGYFLAQVEAMKNIETRFAAMKAINEQEVSLVATYNLGTSSSSGSEWHNGKESVFIVGKNLKNFVKIRKKIFDSIHEILLFDATFAMPELLKRIVELKTDKINSDGYVGEIPFYIEE